MKPNETKIIRIGRLSSVGRVGIELGRVYRAARLGKINTSDASRLATVLLGLKACLESTEVERRLELIEKALEEPSNVTPFRSRAVG
jgi:hypothetical protein